MYITCNRSMILSSRIIWMYDNSIGEETNRKILSPDQTEAKQDRFLPNRHVSPFAFFVPSPWFFFSDRESGNPREEDLIKKAFCRAGEDFQLRYLRKARIAPSQHRCGNQ